MDKNISEEKILDVADKLRQVLVPLWHTSRANVQRIITSKFGINPAQFHTLRRIKFGATTVSDLADCLHVSKPNISRSVEELVQKGFLTRDRTEDDRRIVQLKLTNEAKNLFNETQKQHDQILLNQFRDLSNQELDQLSIALDILLKIIETQDEETQA